MFTVWLGSLPPLVASGVRAAVLGQDIVEGDTSASLHLVYANSREASPTATGQRRVVIWGGSGRRPAPEDVASEVVLPLGVPSAELRRVIEGLAPMGDVEPQVAHAAITPRERDILARVATGATSREIAGALGISERTVEVHRRNLLKKLGVRRSAGLVSTAMARHVLD